MSPFLMLCPVLSRLFVHGHYLAFGCCFSRCLVFGRCLAFGRYLAFDLYVVRRLAHLCLARLLTALFLKARTLLYCHCVCLVLYCSSN